MIMPSGGGSSNAFDTEQGINQPVVRHTWHG